MIFDEWRQDVYDAEDNLIQTDVLFIRAREGFVEFLCPIWEEEETPELIQDMKKLLTTAVKRKIASQN
jgi:hypothetical protein